MDDRDLVESNRNIKMNITGGENFYEKLMILKKEQAEHIKLVERVYFKELSQNNTKHTQIRPTSILKKPQQNPNLVSYLKIFFFLIHWNFNLSITKIFS